MTPSHLGQVLAVLRGPGVAFTRPGSRRALAKSAAPGPVAGAGLGRHGKF